MNVLNGTYQTAGRTSSHTRVSVHSSGTQADGDSVGPSINGDGRYVAFRSVASNLVDNDANGRGDIFVHDRQTDLTERVSIDSFDNQANGWNGVTAISSDGRYVTFVSDADNLVNNDSNGQRDAFIHDRETGATERVNAHSSGA